MSKRQRRERTGCSVESRGGKLRLRFRWQGRQYSRATAVADTAEGREELGKLCRVLGSLIEAERDPLAFLDGVAQVDTPASSPPHTYLNSPTLSAYATTWIAERTPLIRKALARDYRRHLHGYVLPRLAACRT
jgi:hypothetical protein